jgi:1-acyl-sn-glycerol-3-phosphate acyltransferase
MLLDLFAWWFRFKGWKVGESIPADVKKCIVIAAPHTSSWDFVYALAAYRILGLPVNYVAKKELFRFPFSILFKATGGVPVDRSKSRNFVEAIIAMIRKSDRLYLMMAAEGTRKRVEKWKSGFYYAALGAGVPIATGYLDYKNKVAGLGRIIYPTGDKEKDMALIKEFYSDITGRNPELFNPEAIRLD